MRIFITGVDAEGRSCMLSEAEVEPTPTPGVKGHSMDMMYRIDQTPPPPRPVGLAKFIQNNLPPGHLRWMVIDFADPSTYDGPNQSAGLHHTNTNSFLYVVSGNVEFGLQDGIHELTEGDCVMITGVDHSYVAGPGGCRLLVTQVGAPAPD